MDEPSQEEIAARLRALGDAELADVVTFVGGHPDWSCGALLIEACRALDHVHVMQNLGRPPGEYMPAADLDIIVRGWMFSEACSCRALAVSAAYPQPRAPRRRATSC